MVATREGSSAWPANRAKRPSISEAGSRTPAHNRPRSLCGSTSALLCQSRLQPHDPLARFADARLCDDTPFHQPLDDRERACRDRGVNGRPVVAIVPPARPGLRPHPSDVCRSSQRRRQQPSRLRQALNPHSTVPNRQGVQNREGETVRPSMPDPDRLHLPFSATYATMPSCEEDDVRQASVLATAYRRPVLSRQGPHGGLPPHALVSFRLSPFPSFPAQTSV